jgi:hypothetical protein
MGKHARTKHRGRTGTDRPTVGIRLNDDELADLIDMATYYERSMGIMRHVVRVTSSREMRQRFRFIAEESRWLETFARAAHDERSEDGEIVFTARALVAFWGRALSSLQSKRSRRRMSPLKLEQRELLAEKLARSAEKLWLRNPELMAQEVAGRREPEAEWMWQRLDPSDSPDGAGITS